RVIGRAPHAPAPDRSRSGLGRRCRSPRHLARYRCRHVRYRHGTVGRRVLWAGVGVSAALRALAGPFTVDADIGANVSGNPTNGVLLAVVTRSVPLPGLGPAVAVVVLGAVGTGLAYVLQHAV